MGIDRPVRARHRLPLVIAAALLGTAGIAAPGVDEGLPDASADAAAGELPAAEPTHHRDHTAEVALCTVLPQDLVGDLVDSRILDAAGDGTQCTWRLDTPSPAGTDEVATDLADVAADGTLHGVVLGRSAFDAGRPPAGEAATVVELGGVGDEAFVVHLGSAAPSTLYVRDGDRTLSLWLHDGARARQDSERSLTRVASLLLDLA